MLLAYKKVNIAEGYGIVDELAPTMPLISKPIGCKNRLQPTSSQSVRVHRRPQLAISDLGVENCVERLLEYT